MSNLGTGKPDVVGDVVDFSSIASGTLKGLIIALGITERGEPNVPRLVQSVQDYQKYFGGEISEDDFPYLAQNALSRGGRFYVIPIDHYSDITDKSTLVGTKASALLQSSDSSDSSDEANFIASSIGPWANGKLKITTTAAGSGVAGKVDLKVELAGYSSLTINYPNLSQVPTAAEKAQLNSAIRNFCVLDTVTNAIPIGTVLFSAGVRNASGILPADYIGSKLSGTGIYAADTIRDAVRICIPSLSNGVVDSALAVYVDARKDMRAHMRTPLGIDSDTCIDYREATGIYAEQYVPVNSWRSSMWTGGLETLDPATNLPRKHSELLSLLVNYSRKDTNQSSNFSAAGLKRGVIENALGVVKDFGSASMADAFGLMYQRGINAVVIDYDPQTGNVVKLEGNRTLWKTPQFTQKENVAEYLVWLFRAVYPIVKKDGQYDPNDFTMWSALYQQIKPILATSKDAMRAIYDWAYVGDQFAHSLDDVRFNSLEDIANGIYKFRVLIKPTPAAEWIGFEIAVTALNVDFTDFSTPNI